MSLEAYLDDREKRRQDAAADDRNLRSFWALRSADPAERLIAFDRWVRLQLEHRLVWSEGDANKERRIFQCRVELEHMLTQLYSRGWLLDGSRLAGHVTTVLDAVGAAQRGGKVKDFWPYFKAAVNRYVGANAEEIQAESRRAGNVMSGVLDALGVKAATGSMVELIAIRRDDINQEKTLREKVSAARAAKSACKPDAEQLPLI